MVTVRPWRLSLSAQLWALVAVTAALCGTLIALGARDDQARDKERAAADLRASADRTAAWIAPGVGEDNDTEETISKIADQQAVKDLGAACVQTLDGLQQAIELGYLEVVSSSGKVLCTPDAAHRPGAPWSGASALLTAIASGGTVTDGPVTDPWSREPTLFTAVPVGRGASLVYFSPTQDSFVPEDPDDGLESIVVDTRTMTVLMRAPERDGVVGTTVTDPGLVEALRSDRLTSSVGVDGVRRLYHSLTIGSTPYRLVVGVSEEEAYADARASLHRNLLLGGILAVVVVGLGLLLQRGIARPTKRLRAAIEHAGRGEDVLAPTDGPAELADLGEAFNAMLHARRLHEQQLAHRALHDPLTELPNRTQLTDALDGLITAGTPCAAAFLDLDRFKLVNDSHGHAIGDELLVALGQRLSAAVRPGDVVGRFGGDEFVVVVPDLADDEQALEFAHRLREVLETPFHLAHRELFVSGSIGIAVQRAGEDAETVLRNADTAMYRAKARGRDCAAVFDGQMRDAAVAQLQTQSDLHRALERNQMKVLFQPVVDLGDGTVLGAEALVRWQHPEHGMVAPGSFIPIAEETGLVVPIGGWVLRESCSWAVRASRHAGRPVSVAVNVSSRQLAQADFIDVVDEALTTTGLAPTQLCLEVTESLLLEDHALASSNLSDLRSRGVRVALDDFGTGWSSLTYLQQLPVDEIKLDRAFVSKVTEDPTAATIVASLIGMAEAMGLAVTAEGIETEGQLAFLQRHGRLQGQGYLFSRPVPAEELLALLRSGIDLPARQGRMEG